MKKKYWLISRVIILCITAILVSAFCKKREKNVDDATVNSEVIEELQIADTSDCSDEIEEPISGDGVVK